MTRPAIWGVLLIVLMGGPMLAAQPPAEPHAVGPTAGEAGALLDRALERLRSHPRVRGRFEHLYLDRARTMELRSEGRFAMELPRIGITMEGGEVRTIAIDATHASVLVPREGQAPLVLAFRLDTTPLPSLLAVLAGTTPAADLFTVRRVPAEPEVVLELRPIDPTAQVDRLWLQLDVDGEIASVLVVDALGGTHRIRITERSYPSRVAESALAPPFPADAIRVEP